ncbi:MAG TPA: 4a-hydroxytetrahydrobiopterin dehydratase [Thermoanaerobaculia bacterium]|nr:4a-hydroxytetrahydrobiopterin dehydratase [Thermoanaerobaculia bacterium]
MATTTTNPGTSDLAARRCGPCTAGTPPLAGDDLARLLGQLGGGWSTEEHGEVDVQKAGEAGAHRPLRLVKQYRFPDFRQALAFVDRVGEVAEQEGHHPDIELGWGRVKLTVWTHSIGGLSENDFILAAKADSVLVPTA